MGTEPQVDSSEAAHMDLLASWASGPSTGARAKAQVYIPVYRSHMVCLGSWAKNGSHRGGRQSRIRTTGPSEGEAEGRSF